jgi:heat shock protein HslJ
MKRQNINFSIKLFAIIGLLSLGAFAQKNDLRAERWDLIEVNGRRVGESKAYLEFDRARNRFSGSAGCNRMFGAVEIVGRQIDFRQVGTTKMFCGAGSAMRLETDFTRALERVTRYEKIGSTLNLYARNRLLLKFRAAAETGGANAGRLENKKWVLQSIGNRPLPKIETAPFIVFNPKEKSAGGNTGCNVFGGNYTQSGDRLKITNVVSTMRACIEDERMNVERDFKNGLDRADRYLIAGGKLDLYDGRTLLLTFSATENE